MERSGQHTASRTRRGTRSGETNTPNLIALVDLQVLHVIDLLARCSGRSRGVSGDAKMERLLRVDVVAGGAVAHEDQRQFPITQVVAEVLEVGVGLREDSRFGSGQARRFGRGWRNGACDDLDWLQFPQRTIVGDEKVRTPPADGSLNARAGQRRATLQIAIAAGGERLDAEIEGKGGCRGGAGVCRRQSAR